MVSMTRVPLALFLVLSDTIVGRLIFLGIAMLTDVLDGFVARRMNKANKLGALIDPICDRIFVFVVFLTFFLKTGLPFYYLILFLSRDIATAFAGVYIWIKKVKFEMKARIWGKLTTAMQMIALVLLIAEMPYFIYTLYAVFFLSIAAIADYFIFWKTSKQNI